VFIHLTRPNRGPTAGCVALDPPDLVRLLARLGPATRICIQASAFRPKALVARRSPSRP
jgi:L,D-peptidoglycan transpeptidase YkuD (ErfK/YbiS/YcfS/YnhG family)